MTIENIKNILIVNDNTIIQAYYKEMLDGPGRKVDVEGVPYHYIKHGGTPKPDLIILDRKFGKIDIVENGGYKQFLKIAPTIIASSTLPPHEHTKELVTDYIKNKGFYGIASDRPESLETMLARIDNQRRECEAG